VKSVVVFHGDKEVDGVATHPLSRFLAEGFKHCFIVCLSDNYWVRVDGRNGIPMIDVVGGANHDMAHLFSKMGYTTIRLEQAARPLRACMVMNNCVGLVKAVLCLRAPFVQTPFQLYRYLS